MRDHTDYKTPITIRASLNRHVRKRFPHAIYTTAFSSRCYHVGVFYNKQASPEMYDALLAFRVDIHDDIFSRRQRIKYSAAILTKARRAFRPATT